MHTTSFVYIPKINVFTKNNLGHFPQDFIISECVLINCVKNYLSCVGKCGIITLNNNIHSFM